MGRYLTPETIRLWLSGLAFGAAAGLAWWAAGRTRWGGVPFVLAVLLAAGWVGRSDWLSWTFTAAAGAVVVVLAGLGTIHLLAHPAVDWGWVAAGSLVSAVGVWAGVPETGPSLLVGGGLAGLAATGALTRSHWAPTAGVGVAAVVGWAALSGAVGRPWATVGGVLCAGVAPWFALGRVLPNPSWSRRPGGWLLGAHALLVMLASRWIGVVPHPGWGRVAVVAVAGLAIAVTTRRRA